VHAKLHFACTFRAAESARYARFSLREKSRVSAKLATSRPAAAKRAPGALKMFHFQSLPAEVTSASAKLRRACSAHFAAQSAFFLRKKASFVPNEARCAREALTRFAAQTSALPPCKALPAYCICRRVRPSLTPAAAQQGQLLRSCLALRAR